MSKLLCFGDLHLGAHSEYGRAPGDRLRVQGNVLEQIATLAFKWGADAILNVGDTFEGPTVPPEQLDIYARFVEACNAMSTPVIAITGNGKHDAAMRDVTGMQIFNRIDGSIVHSTPALVDLVDGVTIACLPWVHPGRLVAKHGGGDRDEVNREAAELLVATARGMREQITEGSAVLAFHGSVSGATTPDGALTDLFREPVLDAGALVDLGFDAVVCGHIHRPQGLGPRAIYVGSPLPLNFGEASCDHGVWLIDTETADFEFIEIDSPEFITLDLGSNADVDWQLGQSVAAAVGGDTDRLDDAVVRVRFTATRDQMRRIDVADLRRVLGDVAAVVKIVPEIVREDRARVDGVDETLAPLAALDLYLDANAVDGDVADRTRARTALYLEAVAA